MSETFDPGKSPDPQGAPDSDAPAAPASETSPGPAAPGAPGDTTFPATWPPPSGDAPTWVTAPAHPDPPAPGAEGAVGPWTPPGTQPGAPPWGAYRVWPGTGRWGPPAGDPRVGGWAPPTGDQPPAGGPWPPPTQWGGAGGWGGGGWVPPGQWPGGPMWPPPPTRPHPLRVLAVAVAVVVVAAVGIAVGRSSINTPTGDNPTGNNSSASAPPASPGSATIAAKVDPGVVDINTQLGYQNGEAAGTGMVLTSDGYVLTNNHVIAGSTQISVTDVGNGKTYSATVVGEDPSDDVAVIHLTGASGLSTVPLGDSTTVTEGDAVTAIGNAGGTGGTPSVSSGNVIALDQSITATDESDGASEQLSGLIQTDASLQPGDSGGPLVNASGRVVGMDTAASSGFQFQQGSSEGFSIPINTAVDIAHQIMGGHSSSKIHIGSSALLGVVVRDSSSPSGALVINVESGSPADGAGIAQGDVITSLGGRAVPSATGLTSLMLGHHPGDHVQVGWVDSSGQQHAASVQLTTGPAA